MQGYIENLSREMEQIEVFPGSLEEFEAKKGRNYELLANEDQPLVGYDVREAALTFRPNGVPVIGSGNSIYEKALLIEAEALINFLTVEEKGSNRLVSGVPVRQVVGEEDPIKGKLRSGFVRAALGNFQSDS